MENYEILVHRPSKTGGGIAIFKKTVESLWEYMT